MAKYPNHIRQLSFRDEAVEGAKRNYKSADQLIYQGLQTLVKMAFFYHLKNPTNKEEASASLCCAVFSCSVTSFVHGILQARKLECVAMPSSGGSFQSRNRTQETCRWILYQLSHQGSPRILEWVTYHFSRGFSNPGIKPGSPVLQADSLPAELPSASH